MSCVDQVLEQIDGDEHESSNVTSQNHNPGPNPISNEVYQPILTNGSVPTAVSSNNNKLSNSINSVHGFFNDLIPQFSDINASLAQLHLQTISTDTTNTSPEQWQNDIKVAFAQLFQKLKSKNKFIEELQHKIDVIDSKAINDLEKKNKILHNQNDSIKNELQDLKREMKKVDQERSKERKNHVQMLKHSEKERNCIGRKLSALQSEVEKYEKENVKLRSQVMMAHCNFGVSNTGGGTKGGKKNQNQNDSTSNYIQNNSSLQQTLNGTTQSLNNLMGSSHSESQQQPLENCALALANTRDLLRKVEGDRSELVRNNRDLRSRVFEVEDQLSIYTELIQQQKLKIKMTTEKMKKYQKIHGKNGNNGNNINKQLGLDNKLKRLESVNIKPESASDLNENNLKILKKKSKKISDTNRLKSDDQDNASIDVNDISSDLDSESQSNSDIDSQQDDESDANQNSDNEPESDDGPKHGLEAVDRLFQNSDLINEQTTVLQQKFGRNLGEETPQSLIEAQTTIVNSVNGPSISISVPPQVPIVPVLLESGNTNGPGPGPGPDPNPNPISLSQVDKEVLNELLESAPITKNCTSMTMSRVSPNLDQIDFDNTVENFTLNHDNMNHIKQFNNNNSNAAASASVDNFSTRSIIAVSESELLNHRIATLPEEQDLMNNQNLLEEDQQLQVQEEEQLQQGFNDNFGQSNHFEIGNGQGPHRQESDLPMPLAKMAKVIMQKKMQRAARQQTSQKIAMVASGLKRKYNHNSSNSGYGQSQGPGSNNNVNFKNGGTGLAPGSGSQTQISGHLSHSNSAESSLSLILKNQHDTCEKRLTFHHPGISSNTQTGNNLDSEKLSSQNDSPLPLEKSLDQSLLIDQGTLSGLGTVTGLSQTNTKKLKSQQLLQYQHCNNTISVTNHNANRQISSSNKQAHSGPISGPLGPNKSTNCSLNNSMNCGASGNWMKGASNRSSLNGDSNSLHNGHIQSRPVLLNSLHSDSPDQYSTVNHNFLNEDNIDNLNKLDHDQDRLLLLDQSIQHDHDHDVDINSNSNDNQLNLSSNRSDPNTDDGNNYNYGGHNGCPLNSDQNSDSPEVAPDLEVEVPETVYHRSANSSNIDEAEDREQDVIDIDDMIQKGTRVTSDDNITSKSQLEFNNLFDNLNEDLELDNLNERELDLNDEDVNYELNNLSLQNNRDVVGSLSDGENGSDGCKTIDPLEKGRTQQQRLALWFNSSSGSGSIVPETLNNQQVGTLQIQQPVTAVAQEADITNLNNLKNLSFNKGQSISQSLQQEPIKTHVNFDKNINKTDGITKDSISNHIKPVLDLPTKTPISDDLYNDQDDTIKPEEAVSPFMSDTPQKQGEASSATTLMQELIISGNIDIVNDNLNASSQNFGAPNQQSSFLSESDVNSNTLTTGLNLKQPLESSKQVLLRDVMPEVLNADQNTSLQQSHNFQAEIDQDSPPLPKISEPLLGKARTQLIQDPKQRQRHENLPHQIYVNTNSTSQTYVPKSRRKAESPAKPNMNAEPAARDHKNQPLTKDRLDKIKSESRIGSFRNGGGHGTGCPGGPAAPGPSDQNVNNNDELIASTDLAPGLTDFFEKIEREMENLDCE